ncbi:hypothetical protein [Pseudonocardia sp. MH-G8]|nr:hypothetical protein [Pseudonocardia sp. MH-G8]
MGPRRKLQLCLVVMAAVAVVLALSGVVGPASVDPIPAPAAVLTR